MITLAVVIDAVTLIGCAAVLFYNGRLAHSHPGTIYLIFHVLSFSWRLWSIAGGSLLLFAGPEWGWGLIYDPVEPSEIFRAALVADAGLVFLTLAFLRASSDTVGRSTAPTAPPSLAVHHIWEVALFTFPVGLAGLYLFARLPGENNATVVSGAWEQSSWLTNTQTWAGISLLALIYWYGFRSWLVIPMGAYLLLMGYQGFHRFRLIIPLIIMVQIYLDRRQRRWPPLWMSGMLIVAGLLFFSLKTVGQMAQSGASLDEIVQESTDIAEKTLEGDSELNFLDQLAATLTLRDQAGKYYYGQTYLGAITLPIPRPLWPGKPVLNAYQHEISTPLRPMAQAGMIATFLGEAYVNFGYLGIALIPALIGYGLARFYFYAYTQNYYSITRFTYVLIAAVLIQVYRDGLISLVVHTLAAMMPLFLVIVLHQILPDPEQRRARLRALYEPDRR